MAKLSFCIPIETMSETPNYLVSSLLANPALDLQVVVAARKTVAFDPAMTELAATNPKLRIVHTASDNATESELWDLAIQSSSGNWLTLARPADMIDPELTVVAEYLDRNSPQIDAVAWNALQIDPAAPKNVRQSVAIPVDYTISAFDKNVMLQSFFGWENSRATPAMPFGLYHGMIKRSVAETVLGTMAAAARKTCLPQYEWAARVVLLASELAFAARPMSAINMAPYSVPNPLTGTAGFPFHAGIGVTGGIAEIQYALLKEMGSEWGGSEDAFVRACMIDCMLETEAEVFAAKAQAYYEALAAWQGGRYVPLFQPQYVAEQAKDIRRGLHGGALMIDRFIGGATTPQEFYRIVRSFLAPVRLICGGSAV